MSQIVCEIHGERGFRSAIRIIFAPLAKHGEDNITAPAVSRTSLVSVEMICRFPEASSQLWTIYTAVLLAGLPTVTNERFSTINPSVSLGRIQLLCCHVCLVTIAEDCSGQITDHLGDRVESIGRTRWDARSGETLQLDER
ncbi:hypothetical protein T265_02996 [Opisthorchis viverrini]|uniref:Uncharacterized protein n=1 Tax=Opisthorchis viverrini TaxID=6198 RepID=A0A074ZXK2_OPIVI|nr:hypothetical protein T265_02996 [Opisthorchis viverrini]KER30647.1 hypothetical protein T265_02996 [Opisthorchis viverrini]